MPPMSRALTALLALVIGACDPAPDPAARIATGARPDTSASGTLTRGAGATSMPDLLQRFQAATRGRVDSLSHGAASREELATRFLDALERRDTVVLERLRVTPSEFAYLYFPESIFMRPPYELDPHVVWMQLDAASNAGLRRVLRRYGGHPPALVDLICQPPQRQGAVQLHGCDVRTRSAAGELVRERLFGAVIEREGRFKFLSLENRL